MNRLRTWRWQRWQRAAVWGPLALAVFLLAAISVASAAQENNYDRRLGSAETDIAVIKTRIDNIEWIGKMVLATVISQLVLTAFTGFRSRGKDS